MKETTLQTLITARALLEQVERHCSLGDRYMATAGLIVLQDAVELVFLAVLVEKGVDEDHAIEKYSFDEMIAALGKVAVKVPKSGTLRAMNKLRVAAKHYGEVMEPLTVQRHQNVAKASMDSVLISAVGKPLREVFLTELIGNTSSRKHLDAATVFLANGDYLEALIETRKAFFLEFERAYCIYRYRNDEVNKPFEGGLLGFLRDGRKAHYWMKNSKWIAENVVTPFDYVQINYETWRVDAIEWGINTQTLKNIQRLTPDVIQLERGSEWLLRYPASYVANSANRENAAGCLDLTIEVIRRKYDHIRAVRTASADKPYDTPTAYVGQPLFERPGTGSRVLRGLEAGDKYVVQEVLNGFEPGKLFYQISCTDSEGRSFLGYVERQDEPLDEDPLVGADESCIDPDDEYSQGIES